MARRRLTRKEIKQPDQFVSLTVQTLDWVKTHTNQLLYAVCGVIVVIGLVIGWSMWRESRQQQAQQLLYRAVASLNVDDDTTQGKTTPPADREEVVQQLLGIVRDYRGTPASALAQWYLGHMYFARGDFAAALAAYQETQRVMGRESQRLLPALVTLNIGYAQEAVGQCERALSSFEDVVQSSATWLRGEAFLGMGRCHEHTGATDAALTVYDRALSDAAVSGNIRQTIEDRQASVRAKQDAATKVSPQEKREAVDKQ